MADEWGKIISKLIDSVHVLVLLLGAMFVAFGLSKGIGYLHIDDPPAGVGSIAFGVCLFGIGLWIWRHQIVLPTPEPYEIKIQHPSEGEYVHVVEVSGTIKKTKLPEGYTLQVFRLYAGDAFIPVGQAHIDARAPTWRADRCDVAGKPGKKRTIVACLVGPAGAALIDYHKRVTQAHRLTLTQLKEFGKQGDYLPPIEVRTPDMIECQRISVRRDSS